MEVPCARLLVVDRHARDVAGKQVGGELDARVRPLHRGRQGPGQGGLAGTGGVLEQEVALGEHGGQGQFDHVFLVEQRLTDVVDNGGEGVSEPCRVLGGHRHGINDPSGGER